MCIFEEVIIMQLYKIFKDFAEVFQRKISEEYSIKIQFEISDLVDNNLIQIKVENGIVEVYDSNEIEPESSWIMEYEILKKLYRGEMSAITAFANEPDKNGEMKGLINLKEINKDNRFETAGHIADSRLERIQRQKKFNSFFSLDYPTKTMVDVEQSRTLHGVDGIGLFIRPDKTVEQGTMHAFSSIKKGEVLSQPPISHSVYIISGNGIMHYDEKECEIHSRNYYRLEPMTEERIYFKNFESEVLELLYI
jgi:hypothetical protein